MLKCVIVWQEDDMDCLDEQLRNIAGWTKDDLQHHSIVDNNR